VQEGGRKLNVNGLNLQARDFDTPHSYLTVLAKELGLALSWPRPVLV
jgi:hypothetical protein